MKPAYHRPVRAALRDASIRSAHAEQCPSTSAERVKIVRVREEVALSQGDQRVQLASTAVARIRAGEGVEELVGAPGGHLRDEGGCDASPAVVRRDDEVHDERGHSARHQKFAYHGDPAPTEGAAVPGSPRRNPQWYHRRHLQG